MYDEQDDKKSIADSLGLQLQDKFKDVEKQRTLYEEKWIQDLRQYRGKHDPEVLAGIAPERSKAFIRLTRTKVKSMDARIGDMLFPANKEPNWSIDVTPDPDLPQERVKELALRFMELSEGQEPTDDDIAELEKEEAREAMKKMREVMKDQLIESRYQATCRSVIHEANVFGTGVIKGPNHEFKYRKAWKKQQNPQTGQIEHSLTEEEQLLPFFEQVSIWDIYPDMTVTNLEDCEFIFQRHVMGLADLYNLAKRDDFNGERIHEYIAANLEGDSEYKTHETNLRQINEQEVNTQRGRKFEVLEYWGIVDGRELANCGCDIPEDQINRVFEANVWILGNVTIKAILNPSDTDNRPYKFFYFEKDESSIFGEGIPSIMRDTQVIFNTAVRMMLDNAAITAGPQIEVNLDLLKVKNGWNKISPFKVWARTGKGEDSRQPAIRQINIDSHVSELMNLAEMFKQLGDEASAIPSYMHGESDKGVGKTVGGLSMLMGAANITVKDVIKNFDEGVTEPCIRDLYHWNMQYSDKEDIKGDFEVKAVGSSSLVAKEVQATTLTEFAAQTANELDNPYIKRGELNRHRAQALDIPKDVVRTEEEYDEYTQMQEQLAQMQELLSLIPPDLMQQLQAQGAQQ